MRSLRLLDLLVLGLSALSVAEATMVDMNAARLAFRNGVAIQKRQLSGTGSSSTSSSSSTTTPPAPSSTPPTSPTNSPTTPPPTSSTSRSSSTSQSSSSTQSGTTSPSASITPPPNTSGTSSSLIIETSTTFITTTGSNGQSTTITSELTSTQTPGLANNGGAQTGMTPQTRNTVIGVVVGIGGAIILGGLAFVAWRIWGRKRAAEENDDLMDYPSTAGGEKPDTGNSMNGRTPFQSTLESYHTPTQVNTASNF